MNTWHYVVLYVLIGSIVDYKCKPIWNVMQKDGDEYIRTIRIVFILLLWPAVVLIFIAAALYGLFQVVKTRLFKS